MSTRFTLTAAAFLAITLFLSACAANPEPPPTDQLPATIDQQPAAGSQIPTPSPQPPAPNLPDLGPAPDIANEVWLNTDRPLTLEALRGEVVLVEFWTFG